MIRGMLLAVVLPTTSLNCLSDSGYAVAATELAGVPHKIDSFRVVLEPRHHTRLYPEVRAKVVKIHKRMGESFREGEPLVDFDRSVSQALLDQSLAFVEKATTDRDAKRELYQEKMASLLEVREAEAELARAQAELVNAQKNLRATQIIAPYNGKVVDLFIEEHEMPIIDQPIINTVDDEALIAGMLVPSSMLPSLRIGDVLQIVVDETGERVTGHIIRIGSVIDAASSTLKIEAEVDNQDSRMRSGMSGVAIFIHEGGEPV